MVLPLPGRRPILRPPGAWPGRDSAPAAFAGPLRGRLTPRCRLRFGDCSLVMTASGSQRKRAAEKPLILILNGPNLNLLGRREPEIYGRTTYEELETLCQGWADALGLTAKLRQSNHEGALVDWIHEARGG